MVLTKENTVNQYIYEISKERELRIFGVKEVDPRANYLWGEALKTVNPEEKNKLISA